MLETRNIFALNFFFFSINIRRVEIWVLITRDHILIFTPFRIDLRVDFTFSNQPERNRVIEGEERYAFFFFFFLASH